MRKTRLMQKLYSDTPDLEYQGKILEKIDEAKENGSATLEEDGEVLQFAEIDEGSIIVEDQTDGMNEVTRISQNPDDDNDLVLSAVEVEEDPATTEETPENTETVTEETVTESENLASVEISRIPGPDGQKADDIVEDLEIKINEGITDEEKSGTNQYSMKFKNYSKSRAEKVAKLFSACVGCLDKVVESANVDEDVQVKFEGEKMKVMSITIGKPVRTFSLPEDGPTNDPEETVADISEVIDGANKIVELADGGITKENAEEIKNLAEEVINNAEALETEEVSLKSIKRMCSMFSEDAAKVLDETTEETSVTTEETVTESETDKKVSQCPETGKWFIEGDETPYETEDEAKEAAKTFSEPTVTVTIENLEPASVSELLATKEEKDAPTETGVEPVVNPNDNFSGGRAFSVKGGDKKYNNPLLFTEIN